MYSVRTVHACAAAALLLAATQAAPAAMIEVRALSHPNGWQSADPYAPDSRDYGLRLDDCFGVQTFAFQDVRLELYQSPVPSVYGDVYARLQGTIAHLQSSDGATVGYTAGSGLDDLDQRWTMEASFRAMGSTGTWSKDTLPYPQMLDDLLGDGSLQRANRLSFSLFDMTLTPQFEEGVTSAVFTGPRVWDETPGGDAGPDPEGFRIAPRYRLFPTRFPDPQWNVLAAGGWLEPAEDQSYDHVTTFLFTLAPVPEPATLVWLSLGSVWMVLRRMRR